MTDMKRPIIIEGPPFDWEAGAKALGGVCDGGEPNWGAAACADPGVMKCPGCDEHLWREGHVVRCPHCSCEWDTRTLHSALVAAAERVVAAFTGSELECMYCGDTKDCPVCALGRTLAKRETP